MSARQIYFVGHLLQKRKKESFNISEGNDRLSIVKSQKEETSNFLSSDLKVKIWEMIADEWIMGVAFLNYFPIICISSLYILKKNQNYRNKHFKFF